MIKHFTNTLRDVQKQMKSSNEASERGSTSISDFTQCVNKDSLWHYRMSIAAHHRTAGRMTCGKQDQKSISIYIRSANTISERPEHPKQNGELSHNDNLLMHTLLHRSPRRVMQLQRSNTSERLRLALMRRP